MSPAPFEVTIDMFNLNITFPVIKTKDVLVVGIGGTSIIEVYYLTASGDSISFSKAPFEINAHTLFNGSVTLTYVNVVNYKLLMVNTTGTYAIDLLPGATWSLVTSQVNSSGIGVQAETIGQYLVVVRGGGTGNYTVYDLLSEAIVDSGVLPEDLIVHEYSASASSKTHAFFLAFNVSSHEAVIVAYSPSLGWLSQKVIVPGSDSVGLCYGGGFLWLMLKGGSLYRIDFDSATVTNTNIVLPSYPISYGDRLEYYGGKLIFIRDDNTNEVLII